MNARLVKTLEEVETLRQIRNAGRQWMTRDTTEITIDQQRAWWQTACHDPALNVWLFSEAATDIGYGLLRREADRLWCSLAVLPRHRGQGYGVTLRSSAVILSPASSGSRQSSSALPTRGSPGPAGGSNWATTTPSSSPGARE